MFKVYTYQRSPLHMTTQRSLLHTYSPSMSHFKYLEWLIISYVPINSATMTYKYKTSLSFTHHPKNETNSLIPYLLLPWGYHYSWMGVHSSFTCRTPTDHELAKPAFFPQIIMTAERIWEPHDPSFNDNEHAIRASLSYDWYPPTVNRQIYEISKQMSSVSPALDDDNFITSITLHYSYHRIPCLLFRNCSSW
jgi:hypothetical protein